MKQWLPDAGRRTKLFAIALPIIGGMLSQNLLNLIDIAMVGRLGDAALAATGVGSFFNFLSVALVLGLSTGVQATAARRIGQERHSETALSLNGGLFLALLIGVPLSLVLIELTPMIFSVLNSDPEVVEQGTPYMQVRLLGLAAVGMNFSFRGYWSAVHLTRLYFQTIICMHAVNIFLNWVLIFGNLGSPEFGVKGAGMATTISIFIGLLLHSGYALRYARDNGFLRGLPPRKELWRQIQISIPSSLQQMFFAGGMVTLIWILGEIGTPEVAAANVLLTLGLVLMLPALGMGIACSTLVGNALGRNEPQDAELWGWQTAMVTMLMNTSIGLLLILFAKPLLSIFLADPNTLQLAYWPLVITAALIGLDTAGMVLMNALLGAGASTRVMLISLIAQWVFFLPLAWLIGPYLGYGLIGVWILQVGYRVVQSVILAQNWRNGFWKTIEV